MNLTPQRQGRASRIAASIREGLTYSEIAAREDMNGSRHVAAEVSRLRKLGFEFSTSHGGGGGRGRSWSESEIVSMIRQVQEVYGRATAAAYEDWTKHHADRPSLNTVIYRFGSWSAAVVAALGDSGEAA